MSSPSAAKAVRAAEHLAKKQRQCHTSHDQRGGSPMVKGHGIAVLKLQNGSGYDGLLSNAQMHFTRDTPLIPGVGDRFFEQTTSKHILVDMP